MYSVVVVESFALFQLTSKYFYFKKWPLRVSFQVVVFLVLKFIIIFRPMRSVVWRRVAKSKNHFIIVP